MKGDSGWEHLFVLRQAYTAYRFVHTQLRKCDREIERILRDIANQVDTTQTPPPPRTEPYHDVSEDDYVPQHRERAVKRLKQQAKRFGLTVVAQQA